MTTTFETEFTKARQAGVPLMAVSSFDPEATMVRIQKLSKGSDSEDRPSTTPIVQWDVVNGWRARNTLGQDAIASALVAARLEIEATMNPTRSLEAAVHLPEKTILIVLNMRFYLDRGDFVQALWNLRSEFVSSRRTLIAIGATIKLPAELSGDFLIIDELLPTDLELREMLTSLAQTNGAKADKGNINSGVDALRGLSHFASEQAAAMNLTKTGYITLGLWERKRQMVSSTPGLKVYSGPEKFADIGGCDQVKTFFKQVLNGKEAPRVVVFIDEGEKMFSGAVGGAQDSSGVSQDFLGTLLSYTEDNESDGAIFVGPPGAAKSAIAKAVGNEADVPTVVLDLGGMKGSLVGESETNLRNALKVVSAVGGGKAYFIMTCNKIASLPPELRRRFTSGVFFFDLPTPQEREMIWKLYIEKYGLSEEPVDFDEGWTGAEIRNCCRMAYRQSLTLREATEFIVPVSISAAEQIQRLRTHASGAYLSANHKGLYRYDNPKTTGVNLKQTRQVLVNE